MFEVNLRRNLSVHLVCVWRRGGVGHSSGMVPFHLILAHPRGSECQDWYFQSVACAKLRLIHLVSHDGTCPHHRPIVWQETHSNSRFQNMITPKTREKNIFEIFSQRLMFIINLVMADSVPINQVKLYFRFYYAYDLATHYQFYDTCLLQKMTHFSIYSLICSASVYWLSTWCQTLLGWENRDKHTHCLLGQ